MSDKETTNVKEEEANSVNGHQGRISQFCEKPWVKTTGKVAKETGKILSGVALGVAGTIAYLKFSGE